MAELRYSRNIGTISEEEQKLLKQKKVFLAGCGGLGGHIFAHLLRIGVGHITAIDGDCFDETNLNRQLLSGLDTLGKSKAMTAKAYAERVNPGVSVTTIQTFLNGENAAELLAGHDLVFDALDNIDSRRILAAECDRLGIPMVYGGIRGWNVQVGFFPAGTAAERIAMLYPPTAALIDKSCMAFTPAVCASLQAAEGLKYLLGRGNGLGDRLLYADLLENEFEEIPF